MMTARELYALAGTVACGTLALAGLTMPLSDFALLGQRYDAARQLEAVGAACMVVGILAVCLWFYALRRLKSGAPLSIRTHHTTVGIALVFFGLTTSVATAAFPSTKLALQFALHYSPLVMSYLVWSMWKANGTAAM
jgi:hypothetical protein